MAKEKEREMNHPCMSSKPSCRSKLHDGQTSVRELSLQMTDHGTVSFSHLAEVFELLGSGLILISSECIPLGTNMLFSSACVLTLSPVGGCALLVTTQEPGSTFQKKNPTKHLYLPHKAPLYCKLFRVTLQNVCTVPSNAHPECFLAVLSEIKYI